MKLLLLKTIATQSWASVVYFRAFLACIFSFFFPVAFVLPCRVGVSQPFAKTIMYQQLQFRRLPRVSRTASWESRQPTVRARSMSIYIFFCCYSSGFLKNKSSSYNFAACRLFPGRHRGRHANSLLERAPRLYFSSSVVSQLFATSESSSYNLLSPRFFPGRHRGHPRASGGN